MYVIVKVSVVSAVYVRVIVLLEMVYYSSCKSKPF